jgi:hypothetical protein
MIFLMMNPIYSFTNLFRLKTVLSLAGTLILWNPDGNVQMRNAVLSCITLSKINFVSEFMI